ncbi:flavoprotein [Nocardiopsis sp. CNT-189]|uniref:flavoprotein n=1 Tax=Nocardiopsis oceanisediminis TaxID=2816862 RepID=UPI003B3BB9B7
MGRAQEQKWAVQGIATPSTAEFVDTSALEQRMSRPTRGQHRDPGQPRTPKVEAVVVAPASFNTVNKLAAGIADNYALDVVGEALGSGVPLQRGITALRRSVVPARAEASAGGCCIASPRVLHRSAIRPKGPGPPVSRKTEPLRSLDRVRLSREAVRVPCRGMKQKSEESASFFKYQGLLNPEMFFSWVAMMQM